MRFSLPNAFLMLPLALGLVGLIVTVHGCTIGRGDTLLSPVRGCGPYGSGGAYGYGVDAYGATPRDCRGE
jgi:hypothetical protein